MQTKLRKATLITSAAIALTACLVLSGCKQEDDPKPTPPPVVHTNYPDKIEVMPEQSGETVRVHKFDQTTGREVQTEIRYRDGTTATLKLRSDGTKESYRRTNANGSTIMTAEWQSNGNIEVAALRPDGTVKYRQHVALTTSYWGQSLAVLSVDEYAADGKTLTRTISAAAPSAQWNYEVRIPQADGSVIVRGTNYSGYVVHEEHRDASGKVLSQQDYAWGSGPQESFDTSLLRQPDLPNDSN